ncbi:hypothetical protein BLGI_3221 [Brevibacillus laterosporus GI-9]|nr:hypothetical protein P615_05070 [Brevibacillus laterosporus PE36]CCF15279.1 hypothetical protein BLGI_3221 [Brevibacillus laterosporus GI-9]
MEMAKTIAHIARGKVIHTREVTVSHARDMVSSVVVHVVDQD